MCLKWKYVQSTRYVCSPHFMMTCSDTTREDEHRLSKKPNENED